MVIIILIIMIDDKERQQIQMVLDFLSRYNVTLIIGTVCKAQNSVDGCK